VKKLIVCHATGETVLHKAARLGYEVLRGTNVFKIAVTVILFNIVMLYVLQQYCYSYR